MTFRAAMTLAAFLSVTTWLPAATSVSYRVPAVADPGDPVVVHLDMTSDQPQVAAVGVRLTYDDTALNMLSVVPGSGIPASWSELYAGDGPGTVDRALTDLSSAAAVIDLSTGGEVLVLVFDRVDGGCGPLTFGFSLAVPVTPEEIAAYPANQYALAVGTDVNLDPATTTPGSGPATGDHRFLRGNVNARSLHSLDMGDVVDLVFELFDPGFTLAFDCLAASDVNNSGLVDVVDVVALIQGLFGINGFVIPPPTGTPGWVVPDGGTIPSVLGCIDGEVCL